MSTATAPAETATPELETWIAYAVENFWPGSCIFQSWDSIPADYRLVVDGKRLAFANMKGSHELTLSTWIGPGHTPAPDCDRCRKYPDEGHKTGCLADLIAWSENRD